MLVSAVHSFIHSSLSFISGNRIVNMMALSSKLTEAAEKEAGSDGDGSRSEGAEPEVEPSGAGASGGAAGGAGGARSSPTKDEARDQSNHLINFPLLPLTRGGCISLRRGLDSYKKALLDAGFKEELSVFKSEDIALPDVDVSRI